MEMLADCPLKLARHVYSPALAAEIWDICTMLVLVPSATHIWERVVPGGGVHCHWKEPSLATVQERLEADTTLSSLGGTGGSVEFSCRNVIGRETIMREIIAYSAMWVSLHVYNQQLQNMLYIVRLWLEWFTGY